MSQAAAPQLTLTPHLASDRGIVARSVFDAWTSSVAVLAADGTIEVVNRAWERFAIDNGASLETTAVGVNYLEVCERAAADEPTATVALDGLRQVLAGELPEYTLEYPCHAPFEERWFRLSARPLTVAGETRLLVVHDNVSDRKQLQNDVLARSLLLDEVDAAVVATDLDGVVRLWSRAAEALYGWSADEAIGHPIYQLMDPVDAEGQPHAFIGALAEQGSWEGQLTLTRAGGSSFPAQVRTTTVHDAEGVATGMVTVSLDLSLRVAMEEQLARSNRELKAITDSIGDGLCVLDTDGRITYVNPRGQGLLDVYVTEALGVRFATWLRAADGTVADPAYLTAGTPQQPVEAVLARSDGTEVPVEYVATPMGGTKMDHPTGWVIVFRDISERRARESRLELQVEQTRWIGRIRDALATDDFVLFAQPIVDISTGAVVRDELLLRMRDPEDPDNIIPPGMFLPLAEEFGLAPAIDRWVLLQGLRLAATGLPVQINLSATSLDDPTLPHYLEQLLTETGADPTQVTFEITETALLNSEVHAARFAVRAHALGCALSLDDFGTGYGGFTYLKQFPIDQLKIDIEFVRDVTTNPASRHVIDAVVSLGHAFGLTTVGEGVEDQATLDVLRDLKVDLVQGYFLARPGPIARPHEEPARHLQG